MPINFIGCVNTLGYGVCGANLLAALGGVGAEPALFPIGPLEYQKHHGQEVGNALARAEFFGRDAPCLRLFHPFDLAQTVGKGKTGSYTFFELSRLTRREVHHLSAHDVAFAPSAWAARVMEGCGVTARIVVAPPGVDHHVFHNDVAPAPIKKPTPDTTVFLNVGKWSSLKGMDFLLEAFNAAFTPADDVLLIMACFNPLQVPGFDGPAESARWQAMYETSSLGRVGKIRVVPGRLPDQHAVASLMAAADCGFFPARGEGWNMGLAEMLSMGKWAIHTEYSAHTEFATAAGSLPIECGETEEAYDPPFIRPGVGNWALLGPSQLEQAVTHLRAAHRFRQGGVLVNEKGPELFSRLTWVNCAATIVENLR
jgi:glycosyltransferase involved in cell wall biosynthesis